MSRPNLPVAAHRYPPPMSPMPPQQPPPRGGGGFGRQLIGMVAWGAGISFAFAGISYLFGGRRSQEVHHAAPQHQAPRRSAPNPAINRPIVNCTIEEEVLQQVSLDPFGTTCTLSCCCTTVRQQYPILSGPLID